MRSPQRIRLDSRVTGAAWNAQPAEPTLVLECEAGSGVALLRAHEGIVRMWDDPLAALEWMPAHLDELDAADARWVGYLSYDLGRLFERLPVLAVDDLRLPLYAFTLHEGPTRAAWHAGEQSPRQAQTLTSNFTRDAYVAAVERAIDYIGAGDAFQVNLSQRFTAALTEHPSRIYARLRRESPALYGAYLDHLDYALLCNSPELFLKVQRDAATGRRTATTRPIKGTRARSEGMALQLRDSEKDQAELNMIIDLERNDLGRVCEIGSVRVSQGRTIESHPTVYHGAATVEGALREDVGFVDLLRATFPGGSVTGAPKIRAMEIIEELEPTRRGPYCGAIGYLAKDGTVELNVAIRTMIVRDGLVHVPVGGGIVADSDPQAEYEETLVKAKAMFAALGVSAADLQG
ncbi:MAG TPA: anthranilate synthase component I family protein [Tepidisphaeraceae bacterium]|nr:anthranilate synthase component I family protein [Tepidisphaeraceae bacterium]